MNQQAAELALLSAARTEQLARAKWAKWEVVFACICGPWPKKWSK